ncbi:glycerol dehydrogenase [Clostridia bacterium]|nr:glycerol dehydrogenase [Clostridia bacterium]
MSYVEKTTRGWGSPSRYVQGPGEIENLVKYTSIYGKKVLAVIDPFFFADLTEKLTKSYEENGAELMTLEFTGEVTAERIETVVEKAKEFAPEVVVGIGGGKSMDTAKAVASRFHAAMITAPTSASTDAPTAALSVAYKENGEHSHAIFYDKNPDLVLADSTIIAKAPIRFLVSGMGDALSTVFEARANDASDTANYIWFTHGGFRRCKSALVISEYCYETVIKKGRLAKRAAEKGLVTEAVEDIIEANTLMSGLGFENTGCAGAHSIGDGITALPVGSKTLHGEKVAFGIICQLIAEDASEELIEEVAKFCVDVGLPITLEELFVEPTEENLQTIAKGSLNSFWSAEPFNVTEDMIVDIILAGDAIGRYYKGLEK